MLGSLVELAGSSTKAAGSLIQNTGSTVVDTLSFLPFHVVDQVWDLVIGIAGDLGSEMPIM